MTTSQVILSFSPTSCHVFIAIIEQNPWHNRLISWMMLPRGGKSLGPYVNAINKVLQQHEWLLGEDQKRAALKALCPRGHLSRESLKEARGSRWETTSVGVVSLRGLRHHFAMGQRSGSQGREDATSIIVAKRMLVGTSWYLSLESCK